MKPSALLLTIVFGLSLVIGADAAYCHGKPHPKWKPNLHPIYKEEPAFVRSVSNGKLYQGGSPNLNNTFNIVHVWGTPYEMGYARGQLMKNEITSFVGQLWPYLYESLGNGPSWLPPWIQNEIAEVGLDVLLTLTADATEPFTPSYWFEEIHGMVDGIGNTTAVDFKSVYHLSLLGELTKGTCSMYGAWGDAVKSDPSLGLLQLRALDWDTDGPFPSFPSLTVYHPNEGNGHAFTSMGWVGWVGAISGMSEVQTAISEIGIYFTDDTWGTTSRFGYPFTYVLRDILQYDDDVDQAIDRLATTHRTCSLLMGVGDGKSDEFRGFQYDYSVLNVYDDQNLQPLADWHPRFNDIVYWAMDWDCPGYNTVMASMLQKFYGNITVENTIREILPAVQTGDTHIAIYDLTNQYMYLSVIGAQGTLDRNAWQRPFTQLNMKALFQVTRPNE